jgi:GAF domain-containing protein
VERERQLVEAFVALADTLVPDHDVNQFLQVLVDTCVQALGMVAGGVMLVNNTGALEVAAGSSRDMRVLELFELQQQEGPCFDAFESGVPVVEENISGNEGRWPLFGPRAREIGLGAVYAFPLRVRDQVIGALSLFHAEAGAFTEDDIRAAQALADVTALGIACARRVLAAEQLADQLQTALKSRVAIEQAKGILGERLGMDVDAACRIMRRHARSHNRRIHEVARAIVDAGMTLDELTAS